MIDLESIKDPSFIKELSIKELYELCDQIRQFLIEHISVTGGHLSSNLGVVELTVAMYYVFDLDKDEFLFDVGHQSYVHKILTGRAKDFNTLRQYKGISGYIKRSESKYDIWESGHSSTSISAASGLMLSDDTKRPIVVIGDTSISNGIAFEGLNYLGQIKNKCPIIILNDNKMGISKSVGALTKTFLRLRSTKIVRSTKSGFQKILPNPIVRFGHQIKRSIKGFFQHRRHKTYRARPYTPSASYARRAYPLLVLLGGASKGKYRTVGLADRVLKVKYVNAHHRSPGYHLAHRPGVTVCIP